MAGALRRPGGALAAGLLLAFAAAAFLGPLVAGSPLDQALTERLASPSLAHPMGTDHLGRDVMSRALHGMRASLAVAVAVAVIAGLGGGLAGLASGYFGGVLDLLLQRLADAVMAVPLLVFALALLATVGMSTPAMIAVLAVAFAPLPMRVARASALSLRSAPYVDAARALGMSEWRVIAAHVLPNAAGPWLVVVAGQAGAAVLAESSLSFLGFGATEPLPSLGGMLAGQAQVLLHSAPWLVLWPGVLIAVLVLAANLLGDALADAAAGPERPR